MFAFKEEYPMSAMATMAMADVAVPFYQPIIGRDRVTVHRDGVDSTNSSGNG